MILEGFLVLLVLETSFVACGMGIQIFFGGDWGFFFLIFTD